MSIIGRKGQAETCTDNNLQPDIELLKYALSSNFSSTHSQMHLTEGKGKVKRDFDCWLAETEGKPKALHRSWADVEKKLTQSHDGNGGNSQNSFVESVHDLHAL